MPVTAAAHRLDPHQQEPVCVGILANDPLRCIGLQTILEENLQVQAFMLADGPSLRSRRPHVVVMDVGPQNNSGFPESIMRLRRLLPTVPVVVLARRDTPEVLERAVAAGAHGFLPETAEIEDIRACIAAVLGGAQWVPLETEQAQEDVELSTVPEQDLASSFTPKEREVLRWLTHGRSNREIAATMHIDEATVKAHLGRMLRKAKASNRVELTLRVLAQQH